MPVVSQFLIKNLLSQFNRCEKMETKGRDVGDDTNPLAVVGLAIALLTLLPAIMSYRRSRFNGPASSLSSSLFIKACSPPPSLSLIILIYSQPRNSLKQAPKTLLPNHSATIPPSDLVRVNYFFFFLMALPTLRLLAPI